MSKTWKLTTWTKGTGAFVEPLDRKDRPTARARPGGQSPVPRRPWNPARTRADARVDQHRTALDARRRHALRHLDEATLDRLEELERRLGSAPPDRDVAA